MRGNWVPDLALGRSGDIETPRVKTCSARARPENSVLQVDRCADRQADRAAIDAAGCRAPRRSDFESDNRRRYVARHLQLRGECVSRIRRFQKSLFLKEEIARTD